MISCISASLLASRDLRKVELKETTTMEAKIPIMTTTTRISIMVKPSAFNCFFIRRILLFKCFKKNYSTALASSSGKVP